MNKDLQPKAGSNSERFVLANNDAKMARFAMSYSCVLAACVLLPVAANTDGYLQDGEIGITRRTRTVISSSAPAGREVVSAS